MMKRRILALALALGMLFGSTLSVSAAQLATFKLADSGAEAITISPADQAAEDAMWAYRMKLGLGYIPGAGTFGGWSDYQATLDYINNAGK